MPTETRVLRTYDPDTCNVTIEPPDPSLVWQYNVNGVQSTSSLACSIGDAGPSDDLYTLDNPIVVGSHVYSNILFDTPKPDGYYHRLGQPLVYRVQAGLITEIISC